MPQKCSKVRTQKVGDIISELSHSQTKAGKARSHEQNIAAAYAIKRRCGGKSKK